MAFVCTNATEWEVVEEGPFENEGKASTSVDISDVGVVVSTTAVEVGGESD